MHSLYYLLGLFAIGFFTATTANSDQQKTTYHGKMTHQGNVREYIIYVPKEFKKNIPLLIVLHGFTSSADKIMEYTEFNQLAEQHHFAVLYPQGSTDNKGNTFWNVGYDFHADITIDDQDFITQLAEHVQEQFSLSISNTFLTGMSNGAEMCYLLALKYPGKFKAIAPVAGTMLQSFNLENNDTFPLPVLAINGTHDEVTRYSGDPSNEDGWGSYLSITEIIDYWSKAINYHIVQKDSLTDKVKEDHSQVIREKYINKNDGLEVWFYQVQGGGHDWPGAWGNMDINASKEIWHFFNHINSQ